MINRNIKKKYVFLGDTNSLNIEIIANSFNKLREKVNYILIGSKKELKDYLKKLDSNIDVNEIYDPYSFTDYNIKKLNIFNIEKNNLNKFENLCYQIEIANNLSLKTKFDLITMPIDKSIFKKKINFIGMTEYLGYLNNKKTLMLMYGDIFSIIPFTTHINIKDIYLNINKRQLNIFIKHLKKNLDDKKYNLNFESIKFVCYNPHCGENGTLGNEDEIIKNLLSNYNFISGLFPADSAFLNLKKNTLFISTYHDQALIPFKLLNKNSYNLTLGLVYKRLSPSHGTAKDKKFKNMSNNSSYIACMKS